MNFNLLKIALRFYFQDKTIFLSTLINSFLNLGSWLVLFFFIPASKQVIFLHYTIYFGVDWIGERSKIFLIPLTGLAIFLLNLILSFLVYSKQKILSYFLVLVTIFLEILIIMENIFLIIVNT
jgi:hypothetical protein